MVDAKGASRGRALVTFISEDAAKAAIVKLEGSSLNGRDVAVRACTGPLAVKSETAIGKAEVDVSSVSPFSYGRL